MRSTLLALPLALSLAVACGPQPKCGDPEDEETNCSAVDSVATGDTGSSARVVLDNEGAACISGSDPLEVVVTFDDCISSCGQDVVASCSAEVVGSEIVVTGEASYVPPAHGQTCPADCRIVEATCAVSAPSAGDYTLVYAGEDAELVVPMGSTACTPTPRG